MPVGAPMAEPPARPKQATSIVLATVVVIDGAELLALAAPRNPMLVAPGQVSAASHSLTAARHTVPAFPAGCVHVALVPLHTSVVHGSPSSVHAVPFALKASVGQVALVPVQFSATSQTPAEVRQTVLEGRNASAGQETLDPSQVSATSHPPAAAARQTAPAGWM